MLQHIGDEQIRRILDVLVVEEKMPMTEPEEPLDVSHRAKRKGRHYPQR
jgi:hypothetical protein